MIAFEALAAAETDLNLKSLLEPVTQKLGNTAAIARKSYVHPALIELIKEDQAAFRAAVSSSRGPTQHLSRAERGLIAFLEDAHSLKATCHVQ